MSNLDFFQEKFGLELSNSALVSSQDYSLEYILTVFLRHEVERVGRCYINDEYPQEMIRTMVGWICGERASCMLTGSVGVGKTAMLKAILRLFNYLRSPINIPPMKCRTVVYADATEWSQCVIADMDMRYEAYHCQILLMDDVGCECVHYNHWGNKVTPIKDILLYRYAARLPTVVATNLSLQQWAERYGQRLSDRMNELYDFIEYPPHESYRRM